MAFGLRDFLREEKDRYKRHLPEMSFVLYEFFDFLSDVIKIAFLRRKIPNSAQGFY